MGARRMTYDWQADSRANYLYALRMMALSIGSLRFKTIYEMYWQEQHGVIP